MNKLFKKCGVIILVICMLYTTVGAVGELEKKDASRSACPSSVFAPVSDFEPGAVNFIVGVGIVTASIDAYTEDYTNAVFTLGAYGTTEEGLEYIIKLDYIESPLSEDAATLMSISLKELAESQLNEITHYKAFLWSSFSGDEQKMIPLIEQVEVFDKTGKRIQ